MLFHTTFKPRPGYSAEDQKAALQIWAKWSPPEGMEIRSFHISAEGEGFLITQADKAEAVYEAIAPWAGVLLEYKVVPVVEIETAVELLQKAIDFRDSALSG